MLSRLTVPGILAVAVVGVVPRWAAASAETNAAKLLIQSKADVSALTTRQFPQYEAAPVSAGSSPLHFAAMFGETEIISLLLQGGAAVGQPDAAGNAPLHFAAQEGWANAQTLLIAAHAPLDATNHAGGTALRAAVESGAAGNVELLLKAGAHLDVGSDAESLLDVAADRGSTNAINVLLRAGLKLEERDAKGRTPFMRAAAAKQWDAMNLLLAKGSDINAADTNGDTALHLLSAQNQDSAGHQIELSWLARQEADWLMHPGFRHNTITNLVNWKIISQPTGPDVDKHQRHCLAARTPCQAQSDQSPGPDAALCAVRSAMDHLATVRRDESRCLAAQRGRQGRMFPMRRDSLRSMPPSTTPRST